MIRRALFTIFACSVLFFPVVAQDNDDSLGEYERKRAKLDERYSKKHSGLGAFLYGKRMYAKANRQYRRALELDPDNRAARKKLGYEKDSASGNWVRDPEAKLKTKDEAPFQQQTKILKMLRQKWDKLRKAAAKDYAKLADWCMDEELEEQAREVYRSIFSYDPNHEGARAALGFEQEKNRWVSPEELADRVELEKKLAAAPTASPVQESSQFAQPFGDKVTHVASKNCLVESTYLKSDEAVAHALMAEKAKIYFLHVLNLSPEQDPLKGGRFNFILLDSEQEHKAFVDAFCEEDKRKWNYELGATIPQNSRLTYEHWRGERNPAAAKDHICHRTAEVHMGNYVGHRESYKAWLNEGFAYYISGRLNDTASAGCVSLSTGEGGRGGGDPNEWQADCRAWVEAGKDPHIEEVLSHGTNALTTLEAIKGWSLLDMMILHYRPKFTEFLNLLRTGAPQLDALQKAFGWDQWELDKQWKKFVLENY